MFKMNNIEDTFIRKVDLESCNICMKFTQACLGDVSCVIWDAALVLVKYLDLNSKSIKYLQGKKVLELGAGLGCVGLAASCLGAHVVLTDLEHVTPLLKENVELNKMYFKDLGGSAEVRKLEWGDKVDLNFIPDIILISDCVYYENSIKPLLDTIEDFLNMNENAYAILSQELRDTDTQCIIWETFLNELYQRFKVDIISISEQHPQFSSPDIQLMKIYKI